MVVLVGFVVVDAVARWKTKSGSLQIWVCNVSMKVILLLEDMYQIEYNSNGMQKPLLLRRHATSMQEALQPQVPPDELLWSILYAFRGAHVYSRND